MEQELHWYAVKTRWNRTGQVCDMLDRKGVAYYTQSVVPSFLFIHTDADTVERIRHDEWECGFSRMYVYTDPLTHIPVVVPDKEMEVFRIVTSAMQSGLTVLENDPATYQTGDKVRVTDGPFKGAEGYIKRIKKDRRLVVTISGIAAIATSFIPMELLEKI